VRLQQPSGESIQSIKAIGISLADEETLSIALDTLNLGPVYNTEVLLSRYYSAASIHSTRPHQDLILLPKSLLLVLNHPTQVIRVVASADTVTPEQSISPAASAAAAASAVWSGNGPAWLTRADGRAPADWPALLANHSAAVGLPAAALPSLLAAHPSARVVVAAGDPRRSARALAAGRHAFEAHWAVRLMSLLVPPLAAELALADAAHAASFPGAAAGAARLVRPDEEDKAVAAHRKWAERAAAAAAAAGRPALVWDPARDGWGPLCAHLGVPTPAGAAAVPTADGAARWGRRRLGWHAAAYAVLAGPAAAALGLGYWAGRTLGFRAGRRQFRPAVHGKKA
jgi:hypothetical protein